MTDPNKRTTLWYLAPEAARGKSIGKPADIWAIGCIIHGKKIE